MIKDGEDSVNGLHTTYLKNLGKTFLDVETLTKYFAHLVPRESRGQLMNKTKANKVNVSASGSIKLCQ